MAPAWVLLDRFVDVCFEDGNDEAAAAAEKQKGVALQSVIDHLGSMKPDVLLLPAPPRIATFRLVGSTKAHEVLGGLASSSFVACADKSIVVLYGGRYSGPGSSARGCYLVFDSAAAGGTSRQLATVPRLPLAEDLTGIGNGPVVLRRHRPRADAAASYLLAELAATPHLDLPDAELYLWWSDAPTAQWAKKVVRLPREVSFEPGKHIFYADASFSFGPSNLCWVDLLHGIVLCQDPGQQDSQFSFIPLPEGCPSVDVSTDHPFRPRVHEFRSVRYIDGLIKLVAIEGILEGWEGNQFSLAIWTLSPDLTEWKKGEVFRLEDLWAKDEYLMLNLPRYTPVCPVLGESDVVYIIVNDVKLRDIFRGSELLKTEVEVNGQYILELNMRCNHIISVICGHPASLVQLMPSLLATDFTAYLQGSNGVQEEVSEAEESMQRLKVD